MSIANEMGPVEEDTHAKKLRSDLKVWEEFFKTINGRKPGREDIKQHSDIGNPSNHHRYEVKEAFCLT